LAPLKRPGAERPFLCAVLNEVGAVSSPAATGCVAAGARDGSSGNEALLLTLSGGSWTLKAAQEPAGAAAPFPSMTAWPASVALSRCYASRLGFIPAPRLLSSVDTHLQRTG